MVSVPKRVYRELRRALGAVQQELRLLEQDFGLCAECGDRPPAPLGQRRWQAAPVRATIAPQRRRVA
jgi:RNA polymerase-binding transcription factor DksA